MGKSLKELFQTKQFADGRTLAQKYDIRNSKDAEISTANGALGLPFKAATKVRRAFSQTKGETFIEEETTGLRIINTLSAPITYGTDLIRLSKQSTEMVTTMKNGTGASSGDAGIVGNFLNKAKDKALQLTSKLGIAFPETMIPTKISLNSKFKAGKEPNTMVTLSEIKKDAAGTLVGKFLAQNATGTPKQILNGVVGGGIKLAKDEIRKKLFGGRTEAQQLYAKKSPYQTQYDSAAIYSETVDSFNQDVTVRNDLSSMLKRWEGYSLSDINQKSNQLGKEIKVGKAGVAPKGKFVNPKPDPIQLAKSRKQGQIEVGIKIKNAKDNPVLKYDSDLPATSYSNTVDELADEIGLRNDLSSRLIQLTGTVAENKDSKKAPITKSSTTQFPSTNNLPKIPTGGAKSLFGQLGKDISKNGIPTSVSALTSTQAAKKVDAGLITGRKEGQQTLVKKKQLGAESDPILKNDPNVPETAYSNTIDETLDGGNVLQRNDLSSVLVATQQGAGVAKPDPKNLIGIRNKGIPIAEEIIQYSKTYGGDNSPLTSALGSKQSAKDATLKSAQVLRKTGIGNKGVPLKRGKTKQNVPEGEQNQNLKQSLDTKYGITTSNGDYLNNQSAGTEKDAKGKPLQAYDFMAVTFKNVMNQSSVIFRGTITGLAETFSPSWDNHKFIGSPFSYYTYTGIERSVAFNLRIYSTSAPEHIRSWERIEALSKMVYPDIATGTVIVQPPLLMFSLGNPQGGSMYKNRHCFIESLSYSVEDSTPWEIDGGYQAPMVIDAAITVKFIQGVNSSKPLYDFVPGASTGGDKPNKDGTTKNNTSDNSKKAGTTIKGGSGVKDKAKPQVFTTPTLENPKIDSTYVAKPTIKELVKKSLDNSKKKFQGFGGGDFGGGGAGGNI
jgi:hypothetical protein